VDGDFHQELILIFVTNNSYVQITYGAVHKRRPHFSRFFDPLPPSITFCHTLTNPLDKDVPCHSHTHPPYFFEIMYCVISYQTKTLLETKKAHTFLHVLVDVPLAYTPPPPAVTFCHTFLYPLPP
jgi:hypothetical protein